MFTYNNLGYIFNMSSKDIAGSTLQLYCQLIIHKLK